MVRIKVLCALFKPSLPPLRCGGDYEFVYDPACADYDWLVVFDEMPVDCEVLRCPKERTILCTWEPVSIKSYSKAYTRQFGHLLTNRPPEAERHPHYHLGRGYYFWFVGRDFASCQMPVTAPKGKLVSACISAKQMGHTRHRDRFNLMTALAKSVPGLDWYGRGVRPFWHKFEVLDPYKYHVTVENHIAPHHWSEKIADAFLCECLPFYAGDPLLDEVFPTESFIPIPIDDPIEAARIVNAAVAAGEYEKRREAVLEAKRLILEKYNFWAQVIGVIEASQGQEIAPVSGQPVVYGRRELRLHNPLAALEDGWAHVRQHLGLAK
mgnify:CR=1 FL=1